MAEQSAYEAWLEVELNGMAETLSSYVRAAQEGAPEGTSEIHSLLSYAWDGYQVIVREDPRYTPGVGLKDYIRDAGPSMERQALYRGYLVFLTEQAYNRYPLRQFVLAQLQARLNGTADGSMISDIFDALFTVNEIENGAAYEDEAGEIEYPTLSPKEHAVLLEVYGAEKLSSLTAD